jgi:DNA-binding CsgD family transcriptional regulator
VLTATEREVAELGAEGLTNREVADRLFVSVKTVAGHLTSVYAKLGVRSRTEHDLSFDDVVRRSTETRSRIGM